MSGRRRRTRPLQQQVSNPGAGEHISRRQRAADAVALENATDLMGSFVRADDGTSHYVMHDPTSRHRSLLRRAHLPHRRSNSLDATCAIERDDDAENWHQLRMLSPLYRPARTELPMMPPQTSTRFASFPQMPLPTVHHALYRNQSFPFPGATIPGAAATQDAPASRGCANIRSLLTPKQLSLLQEASKLTGTPLRSDLHDSIDVSADVTKRNKYWTLTGPRVRREASPGHRPASVMNIQWRDARGGRADADQTSAPATAIAPVCSATPQQEVHLRRLPPNLTLPPPPQTSPSPPTHSDLRFFIGSEASTPASPAKRDHFSPEAFARSRLTSKSESESVSPSDAHRDRAYSESSGARRDAERVRVTTNNSLPELAPNTNRLAEPSITSAENGSLSGSVSSVSSSGSRAGAEEAHPTSPVSPNAWSRPRGSQKLRKSESAKYRDRTAHPAAMTVLRRPESFRIARSSSNDADPASAVASVSLNAIDASRPRLDQLDVTSLSTGRLPVGKVTPPLEFLRELEKLRVPASLASDSAALARL